MAVTSRIVIDPHGWLPQPEALQPSDTFPTVQAAVFARQKLRVTYRSRHAETVRDLVVEPHGLASAGNDWYLCAGVDEEVRFLKVSRIEKAILLAKPCSGAELDVAQAWRDHRAQFLDQFTPVVVDAWLRSQRWEEAREWTIRATDAEPLDTSPGKEWRPVRLEFMDDVHAITILLRLGPDVRVETPVEIKTRLLDHVNQIASLYRHYECRSRREQSEDRPWAYRGRRNRS